MTHGEMIVHVLSSSPTDDVYLDTMLAVIQFYIFDKTGVLVQPNLPRNDRELQLAGRMYTVAFNYIKTQYT